MYATDTRTAIKTTIMIHKKITSWIPPEDILYEKHRKSLKQLNKHVSKVCAALMSIGHYNFKVEFCNKDIVSLEVARISDLPFDCPYHHIDVYKDGYCGYFNAVGDIQFEGKTNRQSTLIKDILHK